MAFKTIVSGPSAKIGGLVLKCDIQWTIQVKDGNPGSEEGEPRCNVPVVVTVDGAVQPSIETDENGYITLVFSKGTDLSTVKVEVEDQEYHWTGSITGPEGEGKEFSSEVPVTGTWSVSVVVHDMRPKGVGGGPIALKAILIELDPDEDSDAKTDNYGGAWTKDDLNCEVRYKISVGDDLGAILEKSTMQVKVGGVTVAVSGSWQTEGNVDVRRTKANALEVKAMPNGASVEVEFQLHYPVVFVVGEGPAFPYAIELAIRFGIGQVRKSLTKGEEKAPGTKLADKRKWVIASQYDVHNPPSSLPPNLFVYRDSVRRDDSGNLGRFDVRDTNCWGRLTTAHDPVDVMAFNNPHPGFGVHFCEVKGLRYKDAENRYISVHSIGSDVKLDRAALEEFRKLKDNETAAVQKKFLNDKGYDLDGTGKIHDWRDDGSLPEIAIAAAFNVREEDQGAVAFKNRVTHYATRRRTTGLWFSILRCYCRNGAAALKTGGEMFVNGSAALQSAVDKKHLDGFEDGADWSSGEYYANYKTNFTSETFHPSWFGDPKWSPGEPNLAKAQYYRWVKK